MNSSQLLDYRRLQNIICSLQQQQNANSNYYIDYNDIIPDSDNQYTLGDSNHRFHSLYLGPGTIYMGDPKQSQISVNYCNVLLTKPGLASPYIEFTNSNYPDETESIRSGIHVYYNVACNDLWKRYPDGCNAPFGTVRGETGPRGPVWEFSNTLLPTTSGLNIGSSSSNINNLYLLNTIYLNTIPVTASGGFVSIIGVPIATRSDITNGVSTLSSITSYGLSTVAAQPAIGVSSLSSITSYGLSTVAAQPAIGVSSLSSITSYGLSSVLGTGNATGISSLSSLVSYGLSSIINSNTLQPLMGRVLRVDQLYGNDSLAATNNNKYQIAFKTIGTAMANAQAGECIYVLPGTYNEKIVFSNNVSLRGINTPSVKIQQLGCTVPTTLVTFAQNNRLEDVTLDLTSSNSNATPLIGIFMSNISDPITATKMRGIVVNVDNSAMTCNVPTTVYGIYTTGNSSVLPVSSDDIERSTVNVTSSGPGAKRGIYNDGSNGFRGRNTNIFCKDNPAYPNTSNGTYFGIETNNANAFIFIKSSTSYGYAYIAGNNAADMSQTLGTISLAGTDLPNRTGNGKGFTNSTAQPSIPFSISGGNGGYAYTYLIPGTINSGGGGEIPNYYPVRCPTISMIDQFAFQCYSITSGDKLVAHLFKNSILQSNFSLTLSNGGTLHTSTSNLSLTITKNDNYAIMLSNGNTGNLTNNTILYPLVTVSFY